MIKKILIVAGIALMLTATFTGCGCNKDEENTTPTEPSTTTVIADPEAARVGTLDKFLTNSRCFTIEEKVLRFYLDDAQMEYAGFKVVDPTPLEAIEPGQKITNVEYTSDNGLTAYVNVKNRSDEVAGYKRTNSVKFYALRMVKGNSNAQVHLPNKLGWDNTPDEFKANYGTPLSETTDENGNLVLKYGEDIPKLAEGYSISLVFSNNKLIEFTIELHKV